MEKKFIPKAWSFNRTFQQPNKSIDKVTLLVHRSFVNPKFERSKMKSVTVNKLFIDKNETKYYFYQIHIHNQHLNPNNLVIQDIISAVFLLLNEGFFSEFHLNTLKNYFDIVHILNLYEIEIAFDVPKRRINDKALIPAVFRKEKNTYYSREEIVKQIKKSEFCLYNKSIKYLDEGIIKPKATDDIIRSEFRLRKYRICQINNSQDRSLLNCLFLYQTEETLIRNLVPLLTLIRIQNEIPTDLYKNFLNQVELMAIMTGTLL